MKDELAQLLAAQGIDIQIDRRKRAREEYPRRIDLLKREIDGIREDVERTETEIKDKKKSRGLVEQEIEAERESLAKREKRLLETKTNKEYTAVQHEIVTARERIDALETEELELMGAIDVLEKSLEDMKTRRVEIDEKNSKEINELQEAFDSIESDIAKLDRDRERSLKGVNKRAIDVYTRLRRGKSGLAVVTVDPVKLSCRGCFKQLPPQKMLEVRRGEKLIFCESCGRLLMWDPKEPF